MACDGAKVVRMSGSGATCFALFDDFDLLVSAQNKVSKDCPSFWCKEGRLIWHVLWCSPLNQKV